MTHEEEYKALTRAERSNHIRRGHGQEYGPEWRLRIPNGYGYEFADWHRDLHAEGRGHRA
jgi:hypothetical protein